jgi:hypothetical protein
MSVKDGIDVRARMAICMQSTQVQSVHIHTYVSLMLTDSAAGLLALLHCAACQHRHQPQQEGRPGQAAY